MSDAGIGASALEAWFEAASIHDPELVRDALPELDELARRAVEAGDRDAVEYGERAWSRWLTRVERTNEWAVPDAWRAVIEGADRIIGRAMADTAPIAAMHTLDEIAMDVMFVFRDSPTEELTTDEVLQRVLHGDSADVDYRGYLDRLAARALLGVRWRPDRQHWRLSPLGLRTLQAIREGVERSIEQALPAEDATTYLPILYLGTRGAQIPEDQLFATRYAACLFAAHALGSCRARWPAQDGENVTTIETVSNDQIEQSDNLTQITRKLAA